MTNTKPLYDAWVGADAAWQAELVREYGSYAGDYRYDSFRNERTERLCELKAAFHAARENYNAALEENKTYSTSHWVRHVGDVKTRFTEN